MADNKKNPTLKELGMLFDVLIILNDRGGTRKTTLMILLLAILTMDGRKARGMEIDDQGRVGRLFGDMVKTLVLPPAESLTKSSAADTGILAPLLSALVKPDPEVPLIVEIGANLSERVGTVLVANRVGGRAHREGCRIGLLAMVDSMDDALALGARSAKLLQTALPTSQIIVVLPTGELGIDPRSPDMSEAARSGFLEVVQPAIAAGRMIVWPTLDKDPLRAFEKMRITPGDFLAAPPGRVGMAGYDPTRMDFKPDPETLHWVGGQFQSDFELHLAELMQEVQRKLGFPLGDKTSGG